MKDRIIKAITNDKYLRIIASVTSTMCNFVKDVHKLNELTTIAFGRLMTVASMISSTNKSLNDVITMKITCDGPVKSMSAVVGGDGTLKGFISSPNAFVENFKIKDLIGKGFLTITKDLGLKNPYIGQVPLYSSDINSDFAYYYTLSEQTPTAITSGMYIDDNLEIKSSVGLMIQALPGADSRLIDIVSYRLDDLGSIASNLKDGKNIYDILNFMFDDMGIKIVEENPISYKCDCSRERVERALISIGKDELEKIINDNKTEQIICDYCKTEYLFKNTEIKNLYNLII